MNDREPQIRGEPNRALTVFAEDGKVCIQVTNPDPIGRDIHISLTPHEATRFSNVLRRMALEAVNAS